MEEIVYYALIDSVPTSPTYQKPQGLYRANMAAFAFERYAAGKWVPSDMLARTLLLGSDGDFDRIDSAQAKDLADQLGGSLPA